MWRTLPNPNGRCLGCVAGARDGVPQWRGYGKRERLHGGEWHEGAGGDSKMCINSEFYGKDNNHFRNLQLPQEARRLSQPTRTTWLHRNLVKNEIITTAPCVNHICAAQSCLPSSPIRPKRAMIGQLLQRTLCKADLFPPPPTNRIACPNHGVCSTPAFFYNISTALQRHANESQITAQLTANVPPHPLCAPSSRSASPTPTSVPTFTNLLTSRASRLVPAHRDLTAPEDMAFITPFVGSFTASRRPQVTARRPVRAARFRMGVGEDGLQEDMQFAQNCIDEGCSVDAVQDVLTRLERRRAVLALEVSQIEEIMAVLAKENLGGDRNLIADAMAAAVSIFAKANDDYPAVGSTTNAWTLDPLKKQPKL